MPFCFDIPYQYTKISKLYPLIFSLNALWLTYFHFKTSILWEYNFWSVPTFLWTQLGHKTRPWHILQLCGLVQNIRLGPVELQQTGISYTYLSIHWRGQISCHKNILECMIQQQSFSCLCLFHTFWQLTHSNQHIKTTSRKIILYAE
jgi:hypothetical protein